MIKNPFDDQPNAWPDAIIIVICAVFIGYMIFVMWPMLAMVWMMVAW